jgi:hypothetical protein
LKYGDTVGNTGLGPFYDTDIIYEKYNYNLLPQVLTGSIGVDFYDDSGMFTSDSIAITAQSDFMGSKTFPLLTVQSPSTLSIQLSVSGALNPNLSNIVFEVFYRTLF